MAFFCLPRFAHFLRAIRQGMPTLQIDRTKPIELWPRHSQCLSKSSGALAIRLEVVSPLPKASDLSVPSAFDLHTQTHKEFFPVFLWRWVCDQHVRVSPKKLCDSRCPVGGRHARLSVRQCVCVCVCARCAYFSPRAAHPKTRPPVPPKEETKRQHLAQNADIQSVPLIVLLHSFFCLAMADGGRRLAHRQRWCGTRARGAVEARTVESNRRGPTTDPALVVQNKAQAVRSNDRIPYEIVVPDACARQQKRHGPDTAARGRRTQAARPKRGTDAREGSLPLSARDAVAGIE